MYMQCRQPLRCSHTEKTKLKYLRDKDEIYHLCKYVSIPLHQYLRCNTKKGEYDQEMLHVDMYILQTNPRHREEETQSINSYWHARRQYILIVKFASGKKSVHKLNMLNGSILYSYNARCVNKFCLGPG